jgi:hypothetical protein
MNMAESSHANAGHIQFAVISKAIPQKKKMSLL